MFEQRIFNLIVILSLVDAVLDLSAWKSFLARLVSGLSHLFLCFVNIFGVWWKPFHSSYEEKLVSAVARSCWPCSCFFLLLAATLTSTTFQSTRNWWFKSLDGPRTSLYEKTLPEKFGGQTFERVTPILIEMRHPPAKRFQPFPFPKVSFETASTDEPTRETNSSSFGGTNGPVGNFLFQ